MIEISIFIKIYQVKISIYILQDEEDDFYTHYNNIWHLIKNKTNFLYFYREGPHFDYLNLNDDNNNNESIIKIKSKKNLDKNNKDIINHNIKIM